MLLADLLPLTSPNSQILFMEGGSILCLLKILSRSNFYPSAEAAAEHERVRDSYERALKETNPTVLPRVYHGMDRKELYHDGLRWGAVHLREGTRQAHSQFTAFGPKYSLVSTTPYGYVPFFFLLSKPKKVNDCVVISLPYFLQH